MTRRLAAIIFGCVCTAALPAAKSEAAALRVAPIIVDIARGATSTIELQNLARTEAAVQVRIFRWVQQGGRNQLVPTRDMVASPPFTKIKPGQRNVIRIVRLSKRPVVGEESYRVLIDEIPKRSNGRSMKVGIALRYSLRGSIARDDHGISGSFFADGAVAMTKDGLFLSRRIDDAFAVVDAGAPNVEVRLENQVVGQTDRSGKLLVTGLHAYQRNKITIDPNALPVNARVPTTKIDAVPADRSGMSVRFEVENEPKSAIVEFRKADGTPVGAGHTGKLLRTGEEFVIGYDGQGFIEGLAAENTVEIALSDGTCRATFPFQPDSTTQVLIDGVTCK